MDAVAFDAGLKRQGSESALSEAPRFDAPAPDASRPDAPESALSEAPRFDAPGPDASRPDAPEFDLPASDASRTDAVGSNGPAPFGAAGTDAPPSDAAEPDADAAAAPPASLWEKMKADPQYAPEHLALEAVRRLGPEAHEWGMRTRAQRPGIPPDALADLAARKFVNLARLSGAVSGATGIAGAVVDVGVLAWNQARMVLHMAAAYGVDPREPERATDLLVLQKVHKVAETARLALGVAAGREKAGALLSGRGTPMHKVLAKLGVKLAQMAGIRAAKRIFAKIVPGAAIILGTWANSSATTDLAKRTRELYRPRAAYWPTPPQLPGPRQG
ncbi:hypothetical protein Afe04nite_78660 [Asanoa ferruginea]|nr:hypothetical protein Afe04nite_78660 [Asanoa ferruginea]